MRLIPEKNNELLISLKSYYEIKFDLFFVTGNLPYFTSVCNKILVSFTNFITVFTAFELKCIKFST